MTREIKFRAWDNTSKDIGGQRIILWEELDEFDEEHGIRFYEIVARRRLCLISHSKHRLLRQPIELPQKSLGVHLNDSQ